MQYGHEGRASSGQRELLVALLATGVVMVAEGLVGWLGGSLSLMADAGHMLADASGLALSLFAAWMASRPATPQKSYGYYRTEILAALANGILLFGVVVLIVSQAALRLRMPTAMDTGLVMGMAAAGLVVNLVIGRVLSRRRSHSLNLQAAWLNVMSDALGSIGVLGAGAAARWLDWRWADPAAAMLIAGLIARAAWQLVAQCVNVLLEGTPGHLRTVDVVEALRAVPGVVDVHDVHLWSITTGMDAMSGHVLVENPARSGELLGALQDVLARRFGLSHTTLQLEPADLRHPEPGVARG